MNTPSSLTTWERNTRQEGSAACTQETLATSPFQGAAPVNAKARRGIKCVSANGTDKVVIMMTHVALESVTKNRVFLQNGLRSVKHEIIIDSHKHGTVCRHRKGLTRETNFVWHNLLQLKFGEGVVII
mmetsp:Transcript_24082/g.58161  ORF Transcript_24082/g.58161 Transcript_24082/m.58161 type:complete len:128 (+) Transcript_24082:214-597(+)